MRLIDADALREEHCRDCKADIQEGCKTDPVCASLMWVQEAPAIEAEPVKHGRWMPQIVLGQELWCCSECKTLGSREWKRCPICEAKMKKEETK